MPGQLLMETTACLLWKSPWSFNTPPPPPPTPPSSRPPFLFNTPSPPSKCKQSQNRKRKLHLNSNWPKITDTAEPLGHQNLSLLQMLPTINTSFCFGKWGIRNTLDCCHVYQHASFKGWRYWNGLFTFKCTTIVDLWDCGLTHTGNDWQFIIRSAFLALQPGAPLAYLQWLLFLPTKGKCPQCLPQALSSTPDLIM